MPFLLTLLLFVVGLLCLSSAWRAIKEGAWTTRGLTWTRKGNAPMFWLGVLLWALAGMVLTAYTLVAGIFLTVNSMHLWK